MRELRQDASIYLARVKAGETVEVTERGTLIALLTPPPQGQRVRERLIAAGRLIPASSPTGHLRNTAPVTIADGEPTNQDLLNLEGEDRL